MSAVRIRLSPKKYRTLENWNFEIEKVKRIRAYDGYLGIQKRWRTWLPTISFGELETSFDPEVSEWGNSKNFLLNTVVPQPSILEFRLVPFRSPLLRESLLLSFPLVTKMFQFTRFALSSLLYSRSSSGSFLIRVFSDQNLLPVPRNISLVATPFIASEHQGIRRKLLFAWLFV